MQAFRTTNKSHHAVHSQTAPMWERLKVDAAPPLGGLIALWYNNLGQYMGYSSYIEGRRYVTGQLYYNTRSPISRKSPYSITSEEITGGRRYRILFNTRPEVSRAKRTSNMMRHAATVVLKTISKHDLVDDENLTQSTDVTLDALNNYTFSRYSSNFPDPYGLYAHIFRGKFDAMNEEIDKKVQELRDESFTKFRSEIVAYLEANRDAQNTLVDLAALKVGK